MPEITVTILHPAGLHARPAALFVQTAARFASTVQVQLGERRANGKSILSILTLGAKQGASVTISAEGDDAEQALASLQALIESNFAEGT